MAKYAGKIGFLIHEEDEHSSWTEHVVEKPYTGDILRHSMRYETSDKISDDIYVNNQISIIADAFAYKNFQCMKYITYLGANWKITSATIEPPRIIMTIGGVYNAP